VLSAKAVLFVLLGLFAVVFSLVWILDLTRLKKWHPLTTYHVVVGIITDFFDTLGIGSFATTTTLFRVRRVVDDEKIPGTLNIGHCLPTLTQAFCYIAAIDVDFKTLVLLIIASVVGAALGARVVTRLSRPEIQIGMGLALLAAALFFVRQAWEGDMTGGKAIGLDGTYLIIAMAGNFVFGALMTIGVGAYAPIMIMVSLLGMNTKTAFPIMMGSCAFLMPVASIRFIRSGAYDPQAALGLTLGGIPAVLVAAFIVKELPLKYMLYLVIVVVIYTALNMLWTAYAERRRARSDSKTMPVNN